MEVIEILLFILLTAECIYCAISDIKTGIISNKLLVSFVASGVVIDIYYYSKVVPDLFRVFLFNVGITTVLSIILFLTNIWAGGDTKMLIVASILYPARYCPVYNNFRPTFEFVIAFSFAFGFLFLIISSIIEFIKVKRSMVPKNYFFSLLQFMKRYLSMFLYIVLVNLIYQHFIPEELQFRSVALMAVCFFLPFLLNRFKILMDKRFLLFVFMADIVLIILWKNFNIIWNPESFLIVLISASLQILLAEFSYKTIPTSQVSKGMILSLTSSMLLQSSRISGLPGLSHEDLSSRLTEDEAQSVQRWRTSTKGRSKIIIVRKIPFAIFIATGIAFYFIIWISNI